MRVTPGLLLLAPAASISVAAVIVGVVVLSEEGGVSAALVAGGGGLSLGCLVWFAFEFWGVRRQVETGRATAAKLEESRARLQLALRNAAMGSWSYTPLTGELSCCSVVRSLYGYGPDEPFTHEIASRAIHPEDLEVFFGAIEAARTGNKGFNILRRICRRDGEWRWVMTDGCWVHGSDDEGMVLTGVCRDITEEKTFADQLRLARDAAERANEAKSRFLAAASHDLRQPLQALSLYLSVLRGTAMPSQDVVLTNVETCLVSLNALLNDLLDLSKLDSGVIAPKCSEFTLGQLVHNVALAHEPEAARKGIRLRSVESAVHVCSDPVLLQRIIGNLVANAVRYTRTGGVVVGCRRRAGRVWLDVVDSGVGIPEDKQEAIFEEFLQLQNPERSSEKGTGLGLAIVRKTADLLGIRVRVRSRPGHGSTFSVEMPTVGDACGRC